MDELVSLLNRQYNYLIKQDGIKLVRQAKVFVAFIQGDPRLGALAGDLLGEFERAVQQLEDVDSRLLPELIAFRREVAKVTPECDDSDMKRPAPEKDFSRDYESSFAFFDAFVAGTDKPTGISLMPNVNDDNTRFKRLLQIVSGKTYSLVRGYDAETSSMKPEKERKDLVPMLRALNTLEARHDHQFRSFLDFKFSHAGPAWHALLTVLDEMNPQPEPENYWELSQDERNHRLARALHGPGLTLNKALYGLSPLGRDDQAHLERTVTFLKEQCERVYEELHLRIGTQRSHQALINRYKYRCEWHEQARLRDLVKDSRTPEDDLARSLALWLFDQGLNPLTKMQAGNLEPDLLDPMAPVSLYVEAKQYEDSHGTRDQLRRGISQMFDTMARLSGTPYMVQEGYYIVYRRSGPRYILPPFKKRGPFTLYFVLVDIAAAEESGSRQKHRPIIITEDELIDSSKQEDAL